MKVTEQDLRDQVRAGAEELGVPGVSVGVHHDGQAHYAYHGVTSVENPLEVDENTIFQFGSTGKTFTATAMLRLVERGDVDLDAPVRRYVPELRLEDEDVAERVTVLHLLNHTAGWAGDLMDDTGSGDDALERYVTRMADLEQEFPLGTGVSYNNASLSLAGRVIEKVTGQVFEAAIRELILDPLGLEHSFFFANEVMTRRFAVGHKQHPDGTVSVARPWALPRGSHPAGGISADSRDLITWARFHLGDGTAPDGTRLLSAELLTRMQQPTADMAGSALGDAVGISWLLRDVDGVRLVTHGGTTNGQHSSFILVPERDLAVTIMSNCGPNGPQLNDRVTRWVLETYAGVVSPEDEVVDLPADELADYAGSYATIAATVEITAAGGGLSAEVQIKPEVLEQLGESGEESEVGEERPYPLGLLAGEPDRYVVTDGPAKGMKGYFVRDATGRVTGVHLGGRLATRQTEPAPS
ncbi:MAG TPA: serine hydrolase domain-containing protein [Egicoccus sp.]|nr:serine hydrolase domain-containing protein [Egicoccus sp.]HSK24579.1 serine hydrolase domain-containing protein [Egicoccus sp.]